MYSIIKIYFYNAIPFPPCQEKEREERGKGDSPFEYFKIKKNIINLFKNLILIENEKYDKEIINLELKVK